MCRSLLRSLWLVTGPVLILAGCGEGAVVPEVLAPVSGTVLVDGKPLSGILVTFAPVAETKGTGGYGVTDEQGKYSITHRSGEPGIEPGDYKILMSRMAMPDGSPVPSGQSAADVGAEESLPPMYTNYERTKLWDKIPPEGKTVDLEIKTK